MLAASTTLMGIRRHSKRVFKNCVFAQTPEWLDSDSCQKCEQPFFWNFKQMWDSKKIGLRQVRLNPTSHFSELISSLYKNHQTQTLRSQNSVSQS